MYSFRSIALAIATPLVLNPGRISTTDACTLLTPAEASTVLGEKILPGQYPLGAKFTTVCLFSPSVKPSIEEKKATVTIMPIKSFDNGKIPVAGITKTPVSGIGDEALFIVMKGGGITAALNVRKGSSAFQIRVSGGNLTIPAAEDLEKALAADVLKRI